MRILLGIVVSSVLCAACWNHEDTTPEAPAPAKSVQINMPGKLVDIPAILPPGFVTVVDFWSESCGACVVVGGMLAVQVAHAPRVVIRKIDVGDGFTPVAEANEIRALPHYQVYDKRGRLRAELVGNDCLKAPEIAIALAAEQ